jgi:hypothetical protein
VLVGVVVGEDLGEDGDVGGDPYSFDISYIYVKTLIICMVIYVK